MGIVTAHMSMSLDGFVAGPNAVAGNPLGDEGVLIQQWMFDLASFREMQGQDRAMAKRLHEIVKASAPELSPKTWYGMPAYAKDGKVVCFFQSAKKFDSR